MVSLQCLAEQDFLWLCSCRPLVLWQRNSMTQVQLSGCQTAAWGGCKGLAPDTTLHLQGAPCTLTLTQPHHLPAEYKVESTLSKKGASLKFRHEQRALREAAGPGPGAHDVVGCKTCGCNTKPGFTMGQQLKQQEPGSFSPGPAAYDYE